MTTFLKNFRIPGFLLLAGVLFHLTAGALPLQMALRGKSSLQVVLPARPDSLEKLAGTAFQQYFQLITGARIPVVTLHNALPNHSLVLIGRASPMAASQPLQAYNIQTNAQGLHLAGNSPLHTLETVYLFLEQFAGCRFLTPFAEVIPKNANLRVDAGYAFTPIAGTRTVHSVYFYDHPLFAAKRRVSAESFPGYVPIARVHTFNRLVPAARWMTSNPEFFAWTNGRRQPTQLCLSNDTVFHLVLDSTKAWFSRYPQAQVLSVSQDDNTQYCTCNRCSAVDAEEGSPSGSMIRFVNRVAAYFPEKTISTLAYQYTRHAPKLVKPASNVLVTLCSIECDRSAPIADKCKDFEQDLKAWKSIGATVKIWDYTTQFTNFTAPFPNLHTLQPNVQLFVENNARWLFEQHSHQPGELFELRSYLLSQLLWNPYASYDSLYRGFTSDYYGAAAPFIRKYIDTVHVAMQANKDFFLFLYGDPSQGFESFLSLERLQQYAGWMEAAETAVQSDPELLARVRAARLGVDFATLEYCRRSSGPYSFSNPDMVRRLLLRFQSSAAWLQAKFINEMGLLTTDYATAYLRLMESAAAPNLASLRKVTLLSRPKRYAGENPQTLTDGKFGGWSFYANWLGFEKNDLSAVIDLGASTRFSRLGMHFLQVTNHLVFFPDSVSFAVSEDGVVFRPVETVVNPHPLTPESRVNQIELFATQKQDLQARYIKVIGHNRKTAPLWHHGAGLNSWIFADELLVTE